MKRGRSAILNVFLAAATLLVASLVFSYLVGVAAIESNRNVAATRVVLQHLDQLLSALRDAETAQLDFLLTGQEQSLKPYNEALRRVHQEESRLSGFAAAGELPATGVDEVLKLTSEHLTELEQGTRAAGFDTTSKGFSKKENNVNKIFIIVACLVGAVIVLLLLFALSQIHH